MSTCVDVHICVDMYVYVCRCRGVYIYTHPLAYVYLTGVQPVVGGAQHPRRGRR